jgi:hypothetical protein
MKAKRLAELLLLTPEAEVWAFDADCDMMQPITGIVGDATKQEVCTDDLDAGEEVLA